MSSEAKAGFSIREWCPAVGMGRSTFYVLPLELRPKTVKLGKKHLVIESPRDYLDRIAAQSKAA